MLYTSMPLERIYNDHVSSILVPRYPDRSNDAISNVSDIDVKSIDIAHGKIYARKEGNHYVISSINSTELSDYLFSEYTIGSIINTD